MKKYLYWNNTSLFMITSKNKIITAYSVSLFKSTISYSDMIKNYLELKIFINKFYIY